MPLDAILSKLKTIRFVVSDVDGVLTDGGIYITSERTQFKKFNAKDGLAMGLLQKAGLYTGIISHSSNTTIVEERGKLLNVQHLYVGKEEKTIVLEKWINDLKIVAEQVLYIGDDRNDADVMKMVGIAACPADAHSEILKLANIVLKNKGGEGAYCELADMLLNQLV